MEKGKNSIITGLSGLKPEAFERDVLFFENKRKMEFVLTLFITEILHNEGQIAYLRGAIKRRRQNDENFLR